MTCDHHPHHPGSHDHRSHHRRPRRRRHDDLPVVHRTRVRLVRAGALVAAVTAGLFGLTAEPAGAGPRTTSAAIAAEAESAVDALQRWTEGGRPADYVWYVQHRDRAAAMTEGEVDLPSGSLRAEWADVAIEKQHAVLSAVSQLGVPYEYLASEPGVGFDCSGLTIWAFGSAGVDLPRVSSDQIDDAEEVDAAEAQAGDLVYYPGHISIYLGAEMVVHSPNSGSTVEITDLPEKTLRFGDAADEQPAG